MDVVVIGGGFAGLHVAKKLGATLITNSDFEFLPRLPDALREQVDTSISSSQLPVSVLRGVAKRVDTKKKQVYVNDTVVPYDKLVVAIGASPLKPIPGLDTYAKFFTSVADVKYVQSISKKKRVCVVGGGPTGVEIAAQLSDKHEVTLFTGGSLIQAYSKKAQKITRKYLTLHKVRIVPDFVQQVRANELVADKKYHYDELIWCAGVAANKLSGLPYDKGIPTDTSCQVLGVPDVYAVGDCTTYQIKNAQAAIQQANCAIKGIQGKNAEFKYSEKGKFLLLGDTAIIDSVITLHGPLIKRIRHSYYSFQMRQYLH